MGLRAVSSLAWTNYVSHLIASTLLIAVAGDQPCTIARASLCFSYGGIPQVKKHGGLGAHRARRLGKV